MDRKQAQSFIGKPVKVSERESGSYIGILKEIIAEPRKPWRGVVQIQAILELPSFIDSKQTPSLNELKYEANQVIKCEGVKLSSFDEASLPSSFEESLLMAAQERLDLLQDSIFETQNMQEVLFSFIEEKGMNPDRLHIKEKLEEEVVHYTFHHDGDQYILIDENEQRLDLQGCPFVLSWIVKDQQHQGMYEGNGTFLSDNDIRYTPKEGAAFMISKDQFEPYIILRNELEPAALASLEKNLSHYKLTHDDLIDCYNSLLSQLLQADGETQFKGVNFLTYKGANGIVLVQHHYERHLKNDENDIIFDRFEFTTELGKRSLVTYTNEYSV